MPEWDLILHAGFQQTGATMLQRALGRLRPQLRRHGIGFVSHAALMELDALAGWEADQSPDPDAVSAFDREFAGLVQAEAAEVARRSRSGVRAVVVSSDHLLGRENVDSRDARPFRHRAEPAIAQAIRATGAARARLVVYTRRQDRLMEFCYLREIQNGASHAFEEQFPDRFEPLLDYGELLERLASVPRVAEVRARPFELVSSSAARYADDFLAAVGLDGQLDLRPVGTDLTPYRMYSRRALHFALDVNEFLDTERERRLVRQFLKARFPGVDDESTRFLPAQDRARILAAYSPVNRRLFERHLPGLPPDAYAGDEATQRLVATCRLRSDEAIRKGGPTHLPEVVRALTRQSGPVVRSLARRATQRPTVIAVTSRPECGGLWLRRMVQAVLTRDTGRDERQPVRVVSAALSGSPLSPLLVRGRARARQGLWGPLPGSGGRHVVVVARDPHDAVVARYLHGDRRDGEALASRSELVGGSTTGLESLLAAYDTWAEERRRHPDQVMLVRYEDLHQEPEMVLRRVLEFTGLDSPDDQRLEEAVAESWDGRDPLGSPADAATPPAEPRAGHVGSRPADVGIYAEHLEEGEVCHIDERIGRSLGAAAFGYGPDPAGNPDPAPSPAGDAR